MSRGVIWGPKSKKKRTGDRKGHGMEESRCTGYNSVNENRGENPRKEKERLMVMVMMTIMMMNEKIEQDVPGRNPSGWGRRSLRRESREILQRVVMVEDCRSSGHKFWALVVALNLPSAAFGRAGRTGGATSRWRDASFSIVKFQTETIEDAGRADERCWRRIRRRGRMGGWDGWKGRMIDCVWEGKKRDFESWTTLDFLFAPQASSESVRCRECKEKPSIHQGDGLIRPRKGKTRNFF